MRKIISCALAAFLYLSMPAWSAELAAELQSKLIKNIDADAARMSEIALKIWAAPELGYQETKTSALLQDELKRAGFKVDSGVAGMPTAFVARAGSNDGPVIAILAEIDALPGMSQAATPERQADPRSNRRPRLRSSSVWHRLGCGGDRDQELARGKRHQGTDSLYGTPAEEGGGGKVYMVRAGLFKDVDVTLYWHPGDANNASQDRNLANTSAKFRFHGQASHAAVAPDRGRSALDGVEAMNFMVNYMREHVPQETRMHYIITNGGAAPNIVPEFAESYYYVRHPDPRVVAEVFERVKKAAEGAALGTGTTVEYEVINSVYSTLPNDVLGRVVDSALRRVGAPEWTPEELAFAAKLQQNSSREESTTPQQRERNPPLPVQLTEIFIHRFGRRELGNAFGDVEHSNLGARNLGA